MTTNKFKHLLNENVFDFVERTKKLLSIEKQDDIALLEEAYSNYTLKQLQQKGLCLRRIQITDIHTGLYGRTIIKFALNSDDNKEKEIDHKFTVGDIVRFVENDKITGVICKSFRNQLKVAINDGISFQIGKDLTISHKYSLLLLIDNITYKKYDQILSKLSKPNIGIATNIRDLLFNSIQSTNNEIEYKTSINFQPVNKNLNPSQLHAIQCALNANDIFLIHGPPGTGKTTTVIELIYQSLIQHQLLNKTNKKTKILACAPSNIAVDNMVEKLSNSLYKHLINIVRIGHPARILDTVLNKCLESLIRGNGSKNDDKQLVDDIRREIKDNVKLLNKTCSKKERYLVYGELKNLRKELKKYEEKMVNNILNNVDVILCTLCGADRYELKKMEFDVCIIDEAAQSLEVACWIPMIKSRKIILCGDHLQLPPTIKSKNAKELSYTLFDKLQEKFREISYPPKIAMLDTQYRMNRNICQFFSDTLYDGKLKSDESVAHHLLAGLDYIRKKESTEKYSRCLETPLMVVDSAGINGFEEDIVEEHVSKSNINEAEIVAKHVEILINSGVKCCDIAVISPYRGQVKLLKEIINNEKIEIGTVDGFQGREKEAIIVSFVRSNDEHIIGFLNDDRRTNVAITRARRHCCLFLNSETMERHAFLKDLTDFCYENADIRTADEYLLDDLNVIDQFVEIIKNENDYNNEQVVEKKHDKIKKKNNKKQVKNDNNESNKNVRGMNRAQKKKWRKKQKQHKQQQYDVGNNDMSEEDVNEEENENDLNNVEIDRQNDVISLLSSLEQHVDVDGKSKKNKKKKIQYKNKKNKRKQNVKDNKQTHKMKQVLVNKKKKGKQNVNNENKIDIKDKNKKKDDLSDILVNVNAKRCFFKGCKKKVHLLRVQCKFCARIFCMGHGPAIFHSEQCAKKQKIKIEQKKKQTLKEIDKRQYNDKNNIKVLKAGERKQLAKTLREKIEKKENDRVQKSVRKKAKAKDNKNKNKKPKKKIPRRK